MQPEFIGLVMIALVVIFVLAEMHIAFAVGIAGIVGIVALQGFGVAGKALATIPFTSVGSYALFVIPMYMLMGVFVANAGIGTRIFIFVRQLVGKLPGGLPAASVIATSAFSGISGSSSADIAAFGRITVQEMGRAGYSKSYAAAIVAAAGTFAALIPPSLGIILYAIIAEVNIGAMLLAGVIPGIGSAIILSVYVILSNAFKPKFAGSDRQRKHDSLPSSGGALATDTATKTVTKTQAGVAFGATVLLFCVVIGGLYSGVFTAIEAGAVGAFLALMMALVLKDGALSTRKLISLSIKETADFSSMIFLLLLGGGIFGYALAISRVPTSLGAWAVSLDLPPEIIVIAILIILLVLGMFLDGMSIMVLTVPVVAPVALELGFDGIWFGILVLKAIEIGLITPPVGINAFVIAGLVGEKAESIFHRLVPFVILDLVVTGIFFAFPDLILWLPRVAGLAS